MKMRKISLLLIACLVGCTTGTSILDGIFSDEKHIDHSIIVPEFRNVIQNKDLDNSLATHEFERVDSNRTRINSEVVKSRRRITPIMFIRPLSENDSDVCSNSIEDFPSLLTPQQRKQGGVIISFMVGIYCFTLLAIICDNYFLPCVERLCETLNLSQDVAAATFMAMATSAPEFFVNIIGTFVTQSDIGIGTIVGSSMFNTLGVGALGSLAAVAPIQLDWWPVTRDCTLYLIAISLLVVMTWDGVIFWYEGMTLLIVYFLYFTVMFNNKRISKFVRGKVEKSSSEQRNSTEQLTKSEKTETRLSESSPPAIIYYIDDPLYDFQEYEKEILAREEEKISKNEKIEKIEKKSVEESTLPVIFYIDEPLKYYSESKENEQTKIDMKSSEARTTNYNIENEQNNLDEKIDVEKEKVTGIKKFFTMPKGGCKKAFFIYTWPIKFLLFFTVPDPKTKPKLFPLTFIMCILYMGCNSYVVSWMITIIGSTFGIADSILGFTFLAAGGSLPEAISIIIMSRKGEGSMGVSNALGANTMNILLSLGLPWFIKTMIINDSDTPFIQIESGSLEYTILGLMLVAGALYLTLYFNKFRLAKRTGVILVIVYLIFLILAILSETVFVQSVPCDE